MTNTEAPPALFIHCNSMYNSMMKEANRLVNDGDVTDMVVYEGFLTHLVSKLALSVPYYTFCRRALIDMGCIRQIKRGGGRSPSQWELIRSPSIELFDEANPDNVTKNKKGRTGEVDMLKTQISDMNNRLLVIEDLLDELIKGEIK